MRITIDNCEKPLVLDNVEDIILFTRNEGGQKIELAASSEEFMALTLTRLKQRADAMYLGMTFDEKTLE